MKARRAIPFRQPQRRRRRRRPARLPVSPAAVIALLVLAAAIHWLGMVPWVRDQVAGAPASFDIAGPARVVDGDTLGVGGQRIRLHGIDAPERSARCTVRESGAEIACGVIAGERLRTIIGAREVGCVRVDTDRYGRTVATCYAGADSRSIDIGRALVRQGWALAYRRYSERYAMDEAAARLDGAGLWATSFEEPEEARRTARARR